MSDFFHIDTAALDRYITGNYGEDQFKYMRGFCDFQMKNGEDCNLPCGVEDCRCHDICDEQCPHYSPPSD